MSARSPLRRCLSLVAALLFVALARDGGAQEGVQKRDLVPSGAPVVERVPGSGRFSGEVGVIVQLEDEPVARRFPGRGHGRRFNPRSAQARQYDAILADRQARFEQVALTAAPQARVGHRLRAVLNAVTLTVPAHAVDVLRQLPGVRAVYADNRQRPQTTASPAFIGAPAVWSLLGGEAGAGDGVVIGVVDTGVWPEHPSLSDPDAAGQPYGPPPNWGGAPCEFGSAHPDDPAFTCNNKLLGARRVMATYDALETLLPGEFPSARDDSGHGTHLATIAAGNGGVTAAIVGNPIGAVTGVAPRARLAAYKVCGVDGCYDSDVAAAVDQAVLDGVDVLDIALTGGADPYADAVSMALLDAYTAGVFVAAAAGNGGVGAFGRVDPWATTAAATSLNRTFTSTLTLRATGRNTLTLQGVSITQGIAAATSVVNAADAGDPYCAASAPAGTFAGKVVVCMRGGNARPEKGRNVMLRGGVGMILLNPSIAGQNTDAHFVPTVHLEKPASDALLAFLAANSGETATFTRGTAATGTGDVIAPFTSRAGSAQTLGILKPDVAAPGVQIVAGAAPSPATLVAGAPGQQFLALEGTSISSAHVAGAAALLRALNPAWTPAHVNSALMLTATSAVKQEDGVTAANPFDFGSGRIQLQHAARPGLAITAPGPDFISNRARLWDVNYPSLYLPLLSGLTTVRRTVENLENAPATWTLQVQTSPDMPIAVPASVTIPAGGSAAVDITVNAALLRINHFRQAWITFRESGGTRVLRFPITAVRMQGSLPILTSCAPTTFKRGTMASCSIAVSNNSFQPAQVTVFDTLPSGLPLVPGSITNAVQINNSVVWQGTLDAASPGTVDVRLGPVNDGFVSLGGYFAPIPCTGSCDNQVFTGSVPPGILFNGVVYTQISLSTNGLLQLGGDATASPVNLQMPNPAAPNNLLAPFWTNLHPAGTDGLGTGKMYVGYLTFGRYRTWLVVEWNDVVDAGGTARHTFQVWLQVGGAVQEVTYTYSKIGSYGAGGLLTVGAENAAGTSGDTYYYNGAGTPPATGTTTDLLVATPGPTPGGTRTITFSTIGATEGAWTHCGVLVLAGSPEYGASCVPMTVTK